MKDVYSDPLWVPELTKSIEFEEKVQQPVADEIERAGASACDDDQSITVVISDAKEGEPKHWDISFASFKKVCCPQLLASSFAIEHDHHLSLFMEINSCFYPCTCRSRRKK